MVVAAGLPPDTPHQVIHALVSRLQRIIDKDIDAFTAAELPALHAVLNGEEEQAEGGYDPVAGLPPEYDGLDPDPEPSDESQPFLFTLAGLAAESPPPPPLPRPPLSPEEKQRLRAEIERADSYAEDIGREICFAVVSHRARITAAVERFVEPQIQAMLDELARNLEPPQ